MNFVKFAVAIDGLPDSIKREIIKASVVKTLKDMAHCIEHSDYKSVKDRLLFSAAGDGWGDDNTFINFEDDNLFKCKDPEDSIDIGNIMDILCDEDK